MFNLTFFLEFHEIFEYFQQSPNRSSKTTSYFQMTVIIKTQNCSKNVLTFKATTKNNSFFTYVRILKLTSNYSVISDFFLNYIIFFSKKFQSLSCRKVLVRLFPAALRLRIKTYRNKELVDLVIQMLSAWLTKMLI